MNKLQSRRAFIQKFGILGTFLMSMGVFARNVFLYILPERKKKTYHKYLVTKNDDMAVGKAQAISISGKPVFVVRLEEGYRVYSGICSHLGCIVKWEPNKDRFYCPCHQGVFGKDGKVVSGPPPKPLEEYRVKEEGNLVFIYVEDKLRGPWA